MTADRQQCSRSAFEDGLPATGYVRDILERVSPSVPAARAVDRRQGT